MKLALLALAVLTLLVSEARAEPRLFPDSQLVTLDRISVEVVGAGPDVVLIPGLASSRETWRATAQRLRGHYRLHLVQVAGFAGEPTRGNAEGPVLAPVAEAIDGYIVDHKLSPVILVGHSLGGTIGLYLAERHGDHIKALLMVDAVPHLADVMMRPGATPEQTTMVAAQIRANPAMSAANGEASARQLVTAPADQATVAGWVKTSDPSVMARAMADDLDLDLRPGLAAAGTPITLLYPDNVSAGAPPGAVDPTYVAAYAAAPNKTLIRVNASRHFIMLDQPEAFAKALDAFLARSTR